MSCTGWFQLQLAAHHLRCGGVIAHATEGVWGLACDPFNECAVMELATLKQRSGSKGFILIADSLERFGLLVGELSDSQRRTLAAAWPGPVTFLVTAPQAPAWLRGAHLQLAVRVPGHAQARALCERFGGPLVSTSANPRARIPARNSSQVRRYFGDRVSFILAGRTGGLAGPSEIRDLCTGTVVRPAVEGRSTMSLRQRDGSLRSRR
jgi:L-threonylcarbamoyladenylate synthase